MGGHKLLAAQLVSNSLTKLAALILNRYHPRVLMNIE